MVAQPCEAILELVDSLVSMCGPFVARGAKGEEEYPKNWLGGIGEVSSIDKREMHEECGTST